jgi:hypothetical protein
LPVEESGSKQEKSSSVRRRSNGRDGGAPPAAEAGARGGTPVARRLGYWGFGSVAGIVLLVGLGIGLSAAVKEYGRAEERADAKNRVTLTHIAINRAQQQALITRAQIEATQADAEKRFQEAIGIRRAQNEISSTLTANYLQHEAIQAQKAIATSGRNNTLIYVPAGENGVPLVQDPQNVNRLSPTPPR